MHADSRVEGDGPSDFERLSQFLEVLATPGRLELLYQLRTPHAVGDIRLRPPGPHHDGRSRIISRQAVRKHLQKLERAKLVSSRPARSKGLAVHEFLLNHSMLYAIVEELRDVARIRPTVAAGDSFTLTRSRRGGPPVRSGARLIVVHGAREGQTFSLHGPDRPADRGWVIGRRSGVSASLDYDPFVSQEHAEILAERSRFRLLDLRTNKNGTELNWERLPRGGEAPLESGDVIGVGRSLLLFRAL